MIYEILGVGQESARTSREICKALNIDNRTLTTAIEQERRLGRPICASSGANPGYYIASSKSEMKKYCDRLKHRAGEIFKTRQACLNTIDDLPD